MSEGGREGVSESESERKKEVTKESKRKREEKVRKMKRDTLIIAILNGKLQARFPQVMIGRGMCLFQDVAGRRLTSSSVK